MASDYIQARVRLAIAAFVALVSCGVAKTPTLTSIEGSPRVFEDRFNASSDVVRVVLLLSPT
jgi:hypothetical protein